MKDFLLGALKSKTVWVNTIATGIEIANYVTPFIPPHYHAGIVAGVGVANILLRSITNKPLNEK